MISDHFPGSPTRHLHCDEVLVETQRPDRQREYRLHHDSIRAYVARAIGDVALRSHHSALAQRLAMWPDLGQAVARRYALRHALIHRAEAGDWADAWRIAGDTSFLEAKCRELGVHDVEADVARVAERCRVSGNVTIGVRFSDLARALVRESHWLRAAPEATAAVLWNRLRRLGWSEHDLRGHIQVADDAAVLRVRHVATRESPALIRDLVGHADGVNACAVTPDGRRVVSASRDNTLKVWDLESGRVLATLQGHVKDVNACAVTPDGRHVVSASGDKTLKVWDLESGCVLATLQGHVKAVNACAVTPDGRRVVSASDDLTLKVWDLKSGRARSTLEGHASWVNACAVTPEGRGMISASWDRTLKVWDLESGCALSTLEGHGSYVRACAVTPDGRRVVSASRDLTLKVWDLDSGRALSTHEGHAGWVRACAATPDGRRVVSASEDQTLKVWDPESGRALATLGGHGDWVRACAVTPDGRLVVSASDDLTLKVWDMESRHVVSTLEGHTGYVTACAVAPDGRRVVSASDDLTLKVWDLESGRVLATLEGHADRVSACAVTPDGRRVVSASRDRTLKVRDLETGRVLATLDGHASWVTALVLTPDGRRLVSASRDETVKVWDLESGRALATLEGHTNVVTACAVTPDGQRVVSVSSDRTLKIWDLATCACWFTHRGDTLYLAVAASATGIVAGDSAGGIWFLDWPPSDRRAVQLGVDDRANGQHESRPAQETASSRSPMKKHTILFLAANPTGTSQLALGEQARAIQAELERSGYRDCFDLETRWAAQPLDLLRELRKLKPTVVHFSGDGSRDQATAGAGLVFQGADGHAQVVTAQALHDTFGAAGSSVKLVILGACYSDAQAETLCAHVDCVVGMSGSIDDAAARNFAIGFYGGLGERESIAAAFRQGCAAISLEGLRDSDRPQLKVRDGVDASKLVLGFPVSHMEVHHTATVGTQPQAHRNSIREPASLVAKVDIGILTTRDDEFRAVLDAFPQKAGAGVLQGTGRQYILRHAEVATGERYTVAILRQVEQGTGEAQHAARDLIEDLAPKLVLVVGIAGGLPSDDVTLGDVVLGTRIHDYTVEAVKTGHHVTYAATGGPIDRAIATAVAALAGREDELGEWTAALPTRPAVAWAGEGQVYGPPEWQDELRAKLERHHGGSSSRCAPRYLFGPIASSDRLVKDPTVLFPWITTARDLLAVEMESAGVYRAARERCPMLPIRGISNIVGLARADAWTKFACASAAAFARAFLRTRPVPVGASLGAADPR